MPTLFQVEAGQFDLSGIVLRAVPIIPQGSGGIVPALDQTKIVSAMHPSTPAMISWSLLPEEEWLERARVHEERVRRWTDPHQARAARGETHPVYDFLFRYYSYRPAWLRRWHPGIGVGLAGEAAGPYLSLSGYRRATLATGAEVVAADPKQFSAGRLSFLDWLGKLLAATMERPAFFGCFGLHEWAMVYRQSPEEIRHHAWPLRFPVEELSRFVESQNLHCTHYDAFRFFTPSAKPLNHHQPTRESASRFEQRGCLHANMDLYKWAYKLAPYTPSELVADCFELACQLRELDMRASPYDLRALGFEPVKIETPAGRREYERRQRDLSEQSQPLRRRLLAVVSALQEAVA